MSQGADLGTSFSLSPSSLDLFIIIRSAFLECQRGLLSLQFIS